MSNNFYVYVREFYAVWEPAEGGYYVYPSKITDVEECSCLNDAVASLMECLVDATEHGHEITWGTWRMGFHTHTDGEINLYLPMFKLDDNDWNGGCEVGICMNKPEDKPYEGYC